jgi:hypothetical protein
VHSILKSGAEITASELIEFSQGVNC